LTSARRRISAVGVIPCPLVSFLLCDDADPRGCGVPAKPYVKHEARWDCGMAARGAREYCTSRGAGNLTSIGVKRRGPTRRGTTAVSGDHGQLQVQGSLATIVPRFGQLFTQTPSYNSERRVCAIAKHTEL
jgi:hypothetical protein